MDKKRNKYWKKEKLFIQLERELYYVNYLSSRRSEILNIFLKDEYMYNKYFRNNKAPKWFRKRLNKNTRVKNKRILEKKMESELIEFEDNYKDADWLWW